MLRFDEFLAAKLLFYVSGAVYSIAESYYQFTTPDGFMFRAISGAIASFAVCSILPMLLTWSKKREAAFCQKDTSHSSL